LVEGGQAAKGRKGGLLWKELVKKRGDFQGVEDPEKG